MVLGNLIDAAAAILSNTEKRLETISNNIANTSTPGFKRIISGFATESGENRKIDIKPIQTLRNDSSQGVLKQTGSSLDIAISGIGYFLVRREDQYFLTRAGGFSRGPEGALRTAEGLVLQLAGGADAAVESDAVEILGDGTILDRGTPVGRIGVYAAPSDGVDRGGGLIRIASEPDLADEGAYEVRQAMLELSNVVLSDEMVALMANTRQAEGGAQLVRLYDQLIGQAITTFARAGR